MELSFWIKAVEEKESGIGHVYEYFIDSFQSSVGRSYLYPFTLSFALFGIQLENISYPWPINHARDLNYWSVVRQ